MRKMLGALGASSFGVRVWRAWVCAGGLAWLSGCAGSAPAPEATPTRGDETAHANASSSSPDCSRFWQRMSQVLPGTWTVTLPNGKQITESFSLVSNQSALVEDFFPPSGNKTISVYHLDQSALMLTHYCGQGNQPRLRSAQVGADSLVLRFLDATNVAGDASVLVEKRLRLISPDAFDQTEVYRGPDGELEETVFHFERVTGATPD